MIRITVLLIALSFSVNAQVQKSKIIFSIYDLFKYRIMELPIINSSVKNSGWEFQRNISDNTYKRDYVVWGRPNTVNGYYSETLMCGFKKGESNIIMYNNSDATFYKKSLEEIKELGYKLKSTDKYRDAEITMYETDGRMMIVMVKPTVKEGIRFTLYTYTICTDSQLAKIDFSMVK